MAVEHRVEDLVENLVEDFVKDIENTKAVEKSEVDKKAEGIEDKDAEDEKDEKAEDEEDEKVEAKKLTKEERHAIINKVKADRGLTGKMAFFDAQRIAIDEGLLPSTERRKKALERRQKVQKVDEGVDEKDEKDKKRQKPESEAEPKKRARGGGRKSEPLPDWLTLDMVELKDEHLNEGIRIEGRLAKRVERNTATEGDQEFLKVIRVHLNVALQKEGGARAAARAAKQQADQTERHLKAAMTSNQRTMQLAALAAVDP